MELLGTAISVAQTLNSAQSELTEALSWLSMFSYESEMEDLQRTVQSLTALLRDAETKQQLSEQARVYIMQIKDAVFDADDLTDELLTLAQRQRILNADGNLSLREKFSHFFSKSNPICVSYWMSRGIKVLKKKLDAIAYDKQFNLQFDPEPLKKRSDRETHSRVNEVEIIGRQDDLDNIIGRLLASNDQKSNNVSVFSIVGIGGLGKTALAQLVYNDLRVTNAFPLKTWTCISDEDQKVLDVKDILCKILTSITDKKPDKDLTLDEVQSQLQQQLAGKKFLLVWDDLWTEDPCQWKNLAGFFKKGETGSYIVVTTRSRETARITGGQKLELQGLSKDNSWSLFERQAFDSEQSPPDEELVVLGKQIVDGCGGVPLAINVAGSLLYGQHKSKWLAVKDIGLSNTGIGELNIMSILKLSYYQLESSLRSCFSYCALFPKDSIMRKDMLIRLWMAQGYITPLTGQSIDDAGEEYFSILLKRCFFQDIQKNKDGEIKYCKIHDLMHDIAQKVSGKEIFAWNTHNGKVDKDVRHLSVLNWSQFEKCFSLGSTHIRSLLPIDLIPPKDHHCELPMEVLVKSFKRLRVLDLSKKNIKSLPDSIGELLHLRYLDLSGNIEMEALPDSITKLCNLQTLILSACRKLKELPKDFNRLVELRVFDITCCDWLRCMPKGMGKLTSLHTLEGMYRVGENIMSGKGMYKSWKQWLEALEDLKSLVTLKGKLKIDITWLSQDVKNDTQEDGLCEVLYLSSLEHLDYLWLDFNFCDEGMEDEGMDDEGMDDEDEGMDDEDEGMEDEGMRMRVMEALQPHSNLTSLEMLWYQGTEMPRWITLLPNLVKLLLSGCHKLKYLPCLGKLCHLKSLILCNLFELEYIKIEESSRELASTSSTAQNLSFYPSLQHLVLYDLPKWKGWRRGVELELKTHLIIFPQLKKLEISRSEEFTCSILCRPMLETLKLEDVNEGMQIDCTNTNDEKSTDEAAINVPNLRYLQVSNGAWLDSMPVESFQSLQKLRIRWDQEMVKLPNNLQYLSALQSLKIEFCKNLTEMPNWMPKLTSLKRLCIYGNSKSLKERCQKEPPGEYWPLIQHIPDFRIY